MKSWLTAFSFILSLYLESHKSEVFKCKVETLLVMDLKLLVLIKHYSLQLTLQTIFIFQILNTDLQSTALQTQYICL